MVRYAIKPMFPMYREPLLVTLEYDALNERRRRTFTDEWTACRFWITKDRAGKHPAVVNQSAKENEMTTKAKKTETKKAPVKKSAPK